MDGIRIVELPRCTMVSSGISTDPDLFAEGGVLMRFNRWWSAIDATRRDRFFPRDFMWYDRPTKGVVWWYAVEDVPPDTNGFDVVDFEGGLYAAAASRDADEEGAQVYDAIRSWIETSEFFEIDEREGHYDLFHVITPPEASRAMGYNQLDIYVPVKVRFRP